jgi:hypothetical protein
VQDCFEALQIICNFSVEILTYAANPVTVNTEQCPLCQMPLLGWLVAKRFWAFSDNIYDVCVILILATVMMFRDSGPFGEIFITMCGYQSRLSLFIVSTLKTGGTVRLTVVAVDGHGTKWVAQASGLQRRPQSTRGRLCVLENFQFSIPLTQVRFQVLTAVTIKMMAFQEFVSCSLVVIYQCFMCLLPPSSGRQTCRARKCVLRYWSRSNKVISTAMTISDN